MASSLIEVEAGSGHTPDERQTRACRQLVAAVMMRALMDLDQHPKAKSDDKPSDLRSAALRWLRDTREDPFSYRWCCDVLGLAHDRISMTLESASLVRSVRHVMSSRSTKTPKVRRTA